jgi:hypothetical protein
VSDQQSGLDRDALIDGLNDLIQRVRAAGIRPVRISIVGGAALALSHIDRRRTVDVDARLDPHDALVRIAERMAVDRDWPADWLNSNATQFFPDWGQTVDWKPLYDHDGTMEKSRAAAQTEFRRAAQSSAGPVIPAPDRQLTPLVPR